MSSGQRRVYGSAVDLWILVLLMLTPIGMIVFAGLLFQQGRAGDALTILLVGAGSTAVTMMFAVPCRYTILEDALSIRAGVLVYQVPLAQIQRIQLSSSWRSAPALSLRRVLVETDKKTYLVSPKDREGFMSHLQEAADQAKKS